LLPWMRSRPRHPAWTATARVSSHRSETDRPKDGALGEGCGAPRHELGTTRAARCGSPQKLRSGQLLRWQNVVFGVDSDDVDGARAVDYAELGLREGFGSVSLCGE
jgi:hypothetical protein